MFFRQSLGTPRPRRYPCRPAARLGPKRKGERNANTTALRQRRAARRRRRWSRSRVRSHLKPGESRYSTQPKTTNSDRNRSIMVDPSLVDSVHRTAVRSWSNRSSDSSPSANGKTSLYTLNKSNPFRSQESRHRLRVDRVRSRASCGLDGTPEKRIANRSISTSSRLFARFRISSHARNERWWIRSNCLKEFKRETTSSIVVVHRTTTAATVSADSASTIRFAHSDDLMNEKVRFRAERTGDSQRRRATSSCDLRVSLEFLFVVSDARAFAHFPDLGAGSRSPKSLRRPMNTSFLTCPVLCISFRYSSVCSILVSSSSRLLISHDSLSAEFPAQTPH